jgi:tetratricopeptide (TPR) repeat protein
LAFVWVGEYDEARRIGSDIWVNFFEGRRDEAIRRSKENLQLYPDRAEILANAAEVLYYTGRHDEALPLYERLLDRAPEDRPISGYASLQYTMRLAFVRRKAGDEEGAQAAARIARQDHAARRAAGERNKLQDHAEAMLAAFEHDPDGVIAALKSAIQRGLPSLFFLDEAIFEDLRDEPRFVALREELDAKLSAEHEKVLQLICINNPAPDEWQPMPETCEGVEEQRAP